MKRLLLVLLLAGCYAPRTLTTVGPRPSACADSAMRRMRRDTTAAETLRLWEAVCAQHGAQARADHVIGTEIPKAAEPGRVALAIMLIGWGTALVVYLSTR